MKEIYEMQANICHTMANAKRLEIISILGEEELPVGEIAEKIGLRMANLSQHLGIMKTKGILTSRREGVHIFYRIANPKVNMACKLMKEVLMEQMSAHGQLSKKVK